MTSFITEDQDRFGVEPIYRELQVAPSTYHAAKSHPPSAASAAARATA